MFHRATIAYSRHLENIYVKFTCNHEGYFVHSSQKWSDIFLRYIHNIIHSCILLRVLFFILSRQHKTVIISDFHIYSLCIPKVYISSGTNLILLMFLVSVTCNFIFSSETESEMNIREEALRHWSFCLSWRGQVLVNLWHNWSSANAQKCQWSRNTVHLIEEEQGSSWVSALQKAVAACKNHRIKLSHNQYNVWFRHP